MAPAPEPSPSPSPSPASVEELYRSILPRPVGETDPDADQDPARQASEATSTPRSDQVRDEGAPNAFYLGSLQITPALHLLHVRAEGALLDTAQPVEDRYYEVRPQVATELPVSTAVLRAAYEARIRRGSSFEVVQSTTGHFADFSLRLPLGAVAELTGAEHFAHGLLETAEVDPGREYFFQLGSFTRHLHSLSLRILPAGRLDGTIGGSLDVVRLDDRAGFFDHEQQSVSAEAGYEVRPDLRAGLGYGFSRVPFTAERPQAESETHAAYGQLRGEILPLTSGTLSVGYSVHSSPNAATGGNRYAGLTFSGRLEKSFTPSTSLILAGTRATHLSNFEENAFYVSNAGDLLLHAGLPFSLALKAGAGYHRNTYRTVASSIAAPRRDGIRGWTLGLARPVTRHAFLRADYRRERRDSNIDAFDSHSNALIVELAVGLFATDPR
jgi:hypothetical protein